MWVSHFFVVGLILMLPLICAVARRLRVLVLLYGIPAMGAFAVMHVFLSPHPSPIATGDYVGVVC